jgi:hypothetical protein
VVTHRGPATWLTRGHSHTSVPPSSGEWSSSSTTTPATTRPSSRPHTRVSEQRRAPGPAHCPSSSSTLRPMNPPPPRPRPRRRVYGSPGTPGHQHSTATGRDHHHATHGREDQVHNTRSRGDRRGVFANPLHAQPFRALSWAYSATERGNRARVWLSGTWHNALTCNGRCSGNIRTVIRQDANPSNQDSRGGVQVEDPRPCCCWSPARIVPGQGPHGSGEPDNNDPRFYFESLCMSRSPSSGLPDVVVRTQVGRGGWLCEQRVQTSGR